MAQQYAFADVWEAVAAARGDAPAQIQGDRRISWRDFDRRADGIAAALLDTKAEHQSKVANFLYNGPEYLEALYGTVKAGFVPVNTNYRYGPDELTYLWDNADCVAVVFHGSFAPTIEKMRDRVPAVRLWLWVDDGSGECPAWAVPYEDAANAPVDGPVAGPWGRSADDLLFIYTGGTTGMPKGVMWRQGDLRGGAGGTNADGGPATPAELAAALPEKQAVLLPACPLMHATGLITALGNVRQGGTIVTLPSRKLDPVELLDAVEREQVGSLAIVGDAFARPILQALDAEPGRWDLSSLRAVISSGVMWSEPVKQGLLKHKPTMVLFDSLGSSEAVGLGSSTSTGEGAAATASFKLGETSRIVTDDGRDVVPGSGEVGMLARSGAIPVGYYKDEAKTAATFRVIDGVRYVIPGDYATVDEDGTVHLLGRGSQCINTAGEKVFPEEVEEVLKEHPAVADAAVVGIPDEKWGEAVCSLVELRTGAAADPGELITHVKNRLASYKAPKHVVVVPTVGRAPNGKPDYKRLKADATEAVTSPTTS